MRTILFRGQRVDNHEIVYGDLITFPNGNCYISINHKKDSKLNIQVYPETVGQFTGLKDLHNSDIYENDKVIISPHSTLHYIITYRKNGFYAIYDNKKYTDICDIYDSSCKIIGNNFKSI